MVRRIQRTRPTAVSVIRALLLVVPLIAIFFLSSLSCFPSPASFSFSSSDARQPQARMGTGTATAARRVPKGCDVFRGEWIPDDDGVPYYTKLSCPLIQEYQNCLKYGRPDRRFLRWRWRRAGCELPRFDAAAFLDAVRDTSLAFVGDSLARNHMQSLMCLLIKVEYPKDISKTNYPKFKTMHYESYNFTVAIFWSPFPVKWNKSNHLWHLHLDEPDDAWLAGTAGFEYVALSAGIWYTRPSMFYKSGRLVGCHHCLVPGIADLTPRYSQRRALHAAFRTIATGLRGTLILRTLSPSHFEGEAWDSGGDCRRTRPYATNETRMAGLDLDFHTAQLDEFARAKAAGGTARMMLMDTTPAMLLRPDGHPSRYRPYGYWPEEKVTPYNDCVHWCLPGPIDVWNEMLFQILLAD